MDWFERLTGFREGGYAETQQRLSVFEEWLSNEQTGRAHGMGSLMLWSLAELRGAAEKVDRSGRLRLSIVQGDVRAMHRQPENSGALFQVASQFNMLEMMGPQVTPEHGVTCYAGDPTQGPACAMAAGAATIYRNYLVRVDGDIGQTAERQLNGLADLGAELSRRLAMPVEALWTMRNGYALASKEGLAAIGAMLRDSSEAERDALRGLLRLGLHTDVEVTDLHETDGGGQLVSQIFCSALPVAYSQVSDREIWEPFARLVLESAYEATLLAGLLNADGALSAYDESSNRVLLTRLGGGAFGNEDAWINDALLRAVRLVGDRDLDVAIVSHGPPTPKLTALVRGSGFATAV